MSNNEMKDETTPGLEDILVQNRYCCPECKSFIEILLLDENNNEIEFRCLNPENFHRKKMKIKEYLNKINKITKFKDFSDKCKEHNNLFQCFCFDCNQNLCNECLETRNHIFHKKILITEMALTEKEREVISDIINHYKKEKEELYRKRINEKNNPDAEKKLKDKEEEIKNMEELITIINNAYNKHENNYYFIINLYDIIINCSENNETIKNKIVKNELHEDEYEKLMKFRKNNIEETLEKQLKSIINEYNEKIEKLSKKFIEEMKYNNNLSIKRIGFEKIKKYNEGIYVGEFEQNLKEGKGKFLFLNGDIYEGDWKNDKKEGKGIYYFNNGNRYEGDFKKDKQEGKGIYFFNNDKFVGDIYEGDFNEGKFNGRGVYYFSNGDRLIGNFSKDIPIGKHVLFTSNNIVKTKEYNMNTIDTSNDT